MSKTEPSSPKRRQAIYVYDMNIARMTDEAEAALDAMGCPVYWVRAGKRPHLVHVSREGRHLEIMPLPRASLVSLLSAAAEWHKYHPSYEMATSGVVLVLPPSSVVAALAARGAWTHIREMRSDERREVELDTMERIEAAKALRAAGDSGA